MPGKRQPDLSEGQKDCLRLVADHLTSKEIARELGISPFTVDQRLDAARKKLNAKNRKDAARIFTNSDPDNISERLVYDPDRVVDDPGLAIRGLPTNPVEQPKYDEGSFEYSLNRKIISGEKSFYNQILSFLAVPPIGGKRHKFSKFRIIMQSLNIAFYSTVTIAMLLVILTGVMRMIG